MSRFIMPRQGVKGQNLSPADGAKLYFYTVGTTTLKTTYTDAAKSVASTNPVVADATGLFAYIEIDGSYDVVLKDKNGVQLWGPETIQELVDGTEAVSIQELTTATMTANTNHVYSVGNVIETAEFATGTGGGGVYDAVLTSGVTPNTFDIIIGVSNALISFVLRKGLDTDFNQYGASGSGSNDVTRFDRVHAELTQGDTLSFGSGTFDLNNQTSKLGMEGKGAATVLAPAVSSQPVLQLNTHSPHWDFYPIRDVTVDGSSKTSDGMTFSGTDEVAGRWDTWNVMLQNCDNGIIKPTGNIGNHHFRSTWRANNVGYSATGQTSPVMHAGNDVFWGCHWDTCDKSAYFVTDPADGGGQIAFEYNIFEGSTGSGIVAQTLSQKMPTVPMNINRCWFELNASDGGTKQIGAYVFNNKDINLRDVGIVTAQGTHLKDVELEDTTMVATACRFDNNTTGSYDNVIDSSSAFVIHDFYGDDTRAVHLFVQNIAHCPEWDGVRIGAQKMAHRSVSTAQGFGYVVSEPFNSGGTYAWTGTTSRNSTNVVDGILSAACTELSVLAGETELSPASARGIITISKWNVVTLAYKQVLGVAADLEVSVWDNSSNKITFGDTKLNQWVTGVALIDSVNRASTGNLNIICRGFNNATAVRFADFQIMAFTEKQDAIDYIDSREFQE